MKSILTKIIPLSLVFVLLGGCVSKSSGIQAAFVDPIKYRDMTCADLVSGKHDRENDLASLSKQQDNSRVRGITYNILLIPGAGALTKDRSDEIGTIKGEISAIESNIVQRCGNTG